VPFEFGNDVNSRDCGIKEAYRGSPIRLSHPARVRLPRGFGAQIRERVSERSIAQQMTILIASSRLWGPCTRHRMLLSHRRLVTMSSPLSVAAKAAILVAAAEANASTTSTAASSQTSPSHPPKRALSNDATTDSSIINKKPKTEEKVHVKKVIYMPGSKSVGAYPSSSLISSHG
jgi:hypothetical protein